MANRNKSYDDVLSEKFKDLKYAQTYLSHIINEENLTIQESLAETIKAMGLKNFVNKSKLSIQDVSDFVAKRKKWSLEKSSKYIYKVFKLEVKMITIPISVRSKTLSKTYRKRSIV